MTVSADSAGKLLTESEMTLKSAQRKVAEEKILQPRAYYEDLPLGGMQLKGDAHPNVVDT